jgi:4-alpha-glucanotransferase
MKILQFAFDSDMHSNPYLLHNYQENCVVYTGTHDNNTTLGWFARISDEHKDKVIAYLSQQLGRGREILHGSIHWHLIELAMVSKAQWAVVPMQDILGLDERARMNFPGTTKGNWQWRFRQSDLSGPHKERLLKLTEAHRRA